MESDLAKDDSCLPAPARSCLTRTDSHGLKNIFSIILANVELLQDEVRVAASAAKRLERIMQAARRGEQLVNTIRGSQPSSTTFIAEPVIHTRKKRILVVDDEIEIVRIILRYLDKSGMIGRGMVSSEQVLGYLQRAPCWCDALITDMDMPNCSGLELCSEVQRIRSGLPILLITGYDRYLTEKQRSSVGIREVLHKPLRREDIVAALLRMLKS